MAAARLVDLLDEHRRFDEALRRIRADAHARRGDPGPLRWLDRALRDHIALEEERLLPVFDRLHHPVPNGSPAVIRRDHRLILGHLDALREGWSDPVLRASHLGRLAGVLEHHDRREARYFKGRLDEALPDGEIAALLDGRPDPGEPPASSGAEEPARDAPEGDRLAWWIATGRVAEAERELAVLVVPPGKGPRLAARVRDRLARGDLPGAWDAWVLLSAAGSARSGEPPLRA